MAIVRNITEKHDIPHEDGEWVEFRKLSHTELADAADVRQEAVFRKARAAGGEVFVALQNTPRDEAASADPLNNYDRAALLRSAICKWSYKDKPTPENIDGLDEETARWAVEVIVTMNNLRPSEDDIKND